MRSSVAGANRGAGAECHVSGALLLALRASRAVGLAPVHLAPPRAPHPPHAARLRATNNYYGYVLLVVLNACIISALVIDLRENCTVRVRSTFSIIMWLLEISAMGVIATIGVLGARSRMETVINCLNILEKFMLVRDGSGSGGLGGDGGGKRRRLAGLALSLLSIMSVPAIFIMVTTGELYYTFHPLLLLHWFVVVEKVAAALLAAQFLLLARAVHAALAAVNRSAQALLARIDNHCPESAEMSRQGRRIIVGFGQLCDAAGLVERAFGPPLVALLAVALFYVIVTPNQLIECVTWQCDFENPEAKNILITLILLNIASQVINLIAVVEPGSNIDEEFQRTRFISSALVSRAARCEPALAFQLEVFGAQTQLASPGYRPCGLCHLARPLLIEIFGAATTVITIILQYRDISRKN